MTCDHGRNARTDTAHGSPVFWAEPFAAPRNLPTGWHWLGPEWVARYGAVMRWTGNKRHPACFDLEPDDGDASSPAAEADGGRVSGAGDVTAATGDEQDGHGDSVPPVADDGTWAEGLLGAAVAVGEEWAHLDEPDLVPCVDHWWADVFDQHRVRLRVVLRRPVRRGDLVWERDIAGFVPGRSEG